MNLEIIANRVRTEIKDHLIYCTGFLSVTMPISAFFENVVIGWSDEISAKSRLMAAGITYLGVGALINYSRKSSRVWWGITEKTNERVQYLHDMISVAAATVTINPLIYLAAGARETKEIVLGTAYATGIAILAGGFANHSADIFRDLIGYKPSPRTPKLLANLKPWCKRLVVTGLVASSIALIKAIYEVTPDN